MEEQDPNLEAKFPKLRNGGYRITSPKDKKYNCVAYNIGNPTRNWNWMPYPTGGYYWPPGIEGDDTIESWTRVFIIHGYRICENGDFEPGLEKVAIYSDEGGVPTHSAKQNITTGMWMSKLGGSYDIEHSSFELLEGFDEHEYGAAVRFMARPITQESAWND